MAGKRQHETEQGAGARLAALRARLTWHRCPSVLWALAALLAGVAAVLALVLLPSEVQRGRAVLGERVCGTDPAPCLTQADGILTLVDDVEYVPLAKNQPRDLWTLRDAAGQAVEFELGPESQESLADGSHGALLLWTGGVHLDSVEFVRQEDLVWNLTDAGWPSISFLVAALLAGARTLLVVPRRLRQRLSELTTTEGPGRAWWGTTSLPDGLGRLDPDFWVWWGLVPVALLVTAMWSVWVFWVLAPVGLVLLHLVRRAIARDRAAGWTDPFE